MVDIPISDESHSRAHCNRRAMVEIALIFLVFFIQGAWPAPEVNEAHYLSKAEHYWNPTWCAHDFFCQSADAHQVFYWSFGWLSLVLPLPALAWTGRLLTWALLAWAWRQLSVAVVPLPGYAVLSGALLAMLTMRASMAGEWVIGGVEAKGFAYVFVLFALAAIAERRWNRAWLLLGAASMFHVIIGGWSTLAAIAVWLALPGQRTPLRQMLWALAGGLLLALVGVLPALALTHGTPKSIVDEANLIYAFQRLPHHLVPRTFLVELRARHAVLILLWLLLCAAVPATAADRPLRRFVAAVILILGAGLCLSLLEDYDAALAAGLLRYYWFRMSDIMVPLGVALLAAAAIARLRPAASRWGAAVLLATIALATWHFGDVIAQRRRDARPPADTRIADLPAWRETCAWLEKNTDPQSVFLVPRYSSTFRWYASRAEVVSRKDIPQDARSIVDWWKRLQDIYTVTNPDGTVRVVDSPVELPAARLLELAEKYGADYAIGAAQPPLPLELVGPANASYAVYRLRKNPALPGGPTKSSSQQPERPAGNAASP